MKCRQSSNRRPSIRRTRTWGKVTTAYDLAGQKTSVVDPRGDTTSFAYDALGNLLTKTDPAGKTTTYTYDLAGRQTSKTDPRGITVTNTYDAGDRLTGQAFPGGSISFVYDALGRPTTMTDPTGTTGYTYDPNSRLTSLAAPQGTVGYTYDAAGNRTSMSLPVRGSIAYVYDAANQLTKLTDWVGQSFTFTYAPDGMPASLNRPGGVNTTYGYDGANRLTSVHHDGPTGAIAHFDYTLDANGNRTAVVSAAGTESYTLDVLNRLTGVTYPNGDAAAYTYDAAGDRLSSTLNGATTNYTYDSAGRLTAAGASSLTYDAASNVTTNGSSSFSWDWAGRLASATVGGTTSTYTYDGDGTRVAATSGGSTTNYVWDRAASLPQLIDDGTQGYVQTDQGLLEQLGSAASFPLSDALGSVRSVASPTASVVATASYDAFGSVRSQTGQSSIFGFTGQQTDSTGLSYLRARYYNPTTGRLLSPDSVQPNVPGTQGYNLYSYVANNPTTATDPTGNTAFFDLALRVGTISLRALAWKALAFVARHIVEVLLLELAVVTGVGSAVLAHQVQDALSHTPSQDPPNPPSLATKIAAAITAASVILCTLFCEARKPSAIADAVFLVDAFNGYPPAVAIVQKTNLFVTPRVKTEFLFVNVVARKAWLSSNSIGDYPNPVDSGALYNEVVNRQQGEPDAEFVATASGRLITGFTRDQNLYNTVFKTILVSSKFKGTNVPIQLVK